MAASRPVSTGRHVTFLPVETLLCLAAQVSLNPPQQLRAGVSGRAPVRPAEEVPAGDQQPVVLHPRIQLAGRRLLPGALARYAAHCRVYDRVRGARAAMVTARTFENARPARCISPAAGEPERGSVLPPVGASHSSPSMAIRPDRAGQSRGKRC